MTSFALTRPAYVREAHLMVVDLPLIENFYRQVLGLHVLEKNGRGAVLGIGEHPLLTLTTGNAISRAPRTAAGLFHNAFLMPDRPALAHWLRHIVRLGLPLDGASDHIVSEAIYLSDPEGNGIEVYADRAHDLWTYDRDGMVAMATHRLDLQALHDSVGDASWEGAPEGLSLGHIHLQVGDVPQAERFYRDVLGLKIMARYPGASFFATGGYHHHLAANIWNSRGAQIRQDGLTGLQAYALKFNDLSALQNAQASLDAMEIVTEKRADGLFLRDPWGIGLTLSA